MALFLHHWPRMPHKSDTEGTLSSVACVPGIYGFSQEQGWEGSNVKTDLKVHLSPAPQPCPQVLVHQTCKGEEAADSSHKLYEVSS